MDIVHTSVLREEVFELLKPEAEEKLLIDCTLGEGGHSEMFLQRCPGLNVVGLDADSTIMSVAKERLSVFGGRMRFYNEWFNQFFRTYPLGDERPDLILFDLGISVYHYEKSGRGFSFLREEALDMRLNPSLEISAADIINTYPESEIADLIYKYGEERYSRRFAKAICEDRQKEKILTTKALADLISRVSPPEYRRGRIHPATRTFQALRISVNGELARLENALENALKTLKPGGRMGVITFHSLEDRIVKHFFKDKNRSCTCPPEQPICNCGGERVVEILTRKPVRPLDEEIKTNAPSRSSKFRVIRKLRDED